MMHRLLKYFLFSALLFALSPAKAQFYGVNVTPVCWTTSGGVDSTIMAVYLSAANTTKPSFLHYFKIQPGSSVPVAVTVSGGTLKFGRCGDAPTVTPTDIQAGKNAFSAINLTANCCSYIFIQNQWMTTYDITVDGISLRLEPGEYWAWRDMVDPANGKVYQNPTVTLTATGVATNGPRYYYIEK